MIRLSGKYTNGWPRAIIHFEYEGVPPVLLNFVRDNRGDLMILMKGVNAEYSKMGAFEPTHYELIGKTMSNESFLKLQKWVNESFENNGISVFDRMLLTQTYMVIVEAITTFLWNVHLDRVYTERVLKKYAKSFFKEYDVCVKPWVLD